MSEYGLLVLDTIFGGIGAVADLAIVALMIREARKPSGARQYWPWLAAMALVAVTVTGPTLLAYHLNTSPSLAASSSTPTLAPVMFGWLPIAFISVASLGIGGLLGYNVSRWRRIPVQPQSKPKSVTPRTAPSVEPPPPDTADEAAQIK
jgi:hypothetical protein